MLLGGNAHNSNAGFICDERMEREADLFAAALLIPRAVIEREARSTGFSMLNGILRMAEECAEDLLLALRSDTRNTPKKRVRSCCHKAAGFFLESHPTRWVQLASKSSGRAPVVLEGSPTARCMTQPKVGTIVEGKWKGEGWFANRYRGIDLWEEATPLGYSGLFLTLLAKESGESEEEEGEA